MLSQEWHDLNKTTRLLASLSKGGQQLSSLPNIEGFVNTRSDRPWSSVLLARSKQINRRTDTTS